jgi:hypothetical protein
MVAGATAPFTGENSCAMSTFNPSLTRSHFPHSIFERQHVALLHVLGNDARKVAVDIDLAAAMPRHQPNPREPTLVDGDIRTDLRISLAIEPHRPWIAFPARESRS